MCYLMTLKVVKNTRIYFSAKLGRKIPLEKYGFWAFYLQSTIKVRTFAMHLEMHCE